MTKQIDKLTNLINDLLKTAFDEDNFESYLQKLSKASLKLYAALRSAATRWRNIDDKTHFILALGNQQFKAEYRQKIRPLIHEIDKILDPTVPENRYIWFYINEYYGLLTAHLYILWYLVLINYPNTQIVKDNLHILVTYAFYKKMIGSIIGKLKNKYLVANDIVQAVKTYIKSSSIINQFGGDALALSEFIANQIITNTARKIQNGNLKSIHNMWAALQSKADTYATKIRTAYITYNKAYKTIQVSDVTVEPADRELAQKIIDRFRLEFAPIDVYIETALKQIDYAIAKDILYDAVMQLHSKQPKELEPIFLELLAYVKRAHAVQDIITMIREKRIKNNIVALVTIPKKLSAQALTQLNRALALYIMFYIFDDLHSHIEFV
jgi:hypothetical protein